MRFCFEMEFIAFPNHLHWGLLFPNSTQLLLLLSSNSLLHSFMSLVLLHLYFEITSLVVPVNFSIGLFEDVLLWRLKIWFSNEEKYPVEEDPDNKCDIRPVHQDFFEVRPSVFVTFRWQLASKQWLNLENNLGALYPELNQHGYHLKCIFSLSLFSKRLKY